MGKRSEAGEYFATLRTSVPTRFPVRWRWARAIPESHADCDFVTTNGSHHYVIRLERGLTEPALGWAIVHEYAHAVCWDYVERLRVRHHHPPEFWLAHGRCWDAIYGVRE